MTETKQTSTTKTDRRPDCVTEIRMGNSVLTVSGFFKQGATDTAADKMMKVLEAEAATRDSGMLGQVERKMELLEEKEKALGMIRFVLRNGRDMAAACARLLMKDEWEIYVAWQREWLSAVAGKEKRQKQVRQFMQMTAEYWQSTQPSRSNKQWKAMAEVVNPSQLSDKHLELIKLVS